MEDFLRAAEWVYRTLDMLVQLRVVSDQSDSDFVPLGDEECWAAPVCSFVGGYYYCLLYTSPSPRD